MSDPEQRNFQTDKRVDMGLDPNASSTRDVWLVMLHTRGLFVQPRVLLESFWISFSVIYKQLFTSNSTFTDPLRGLNTPRVVEVSSGETKQRVNANCLLLYIP